MVEAIDFIAGNTEANGSTVFTRYEVIGKFQSKAEALDLLTAYA